MRLIFYKVNGLKIDKFHSLELLETGKCLTVLIQLFNIESHDIQSIYQVIIGEI